MARMVTSDTTVRPSRNRNLDVRASGVVRQRGSHNLSFFRRPAQQVDGAGRCGAALLEIVFTKRQLIIN